MQLAHDQQHFKFIFMFKEFCLFPTYASYLIKICVCCTLFFSLFTLSYLPDQTLLIYRWNRAYPLNTETSWMTLTNGIYEGSALNYGAHMEVVNWEALYSEWEVLAEDMPVPSPVGKLIYTVYTYWEPNLRAWLLQFQTQAFISNVLQEPFPRQTPSLLLLWWGENRTENN